ncbi:LANO_0F10770g1_1 [Lachancea nothofagi CBS 11611]|uniref:LANO_0F10770g1_1 n=1 Tax=Lachancea nothofagi CBS 11611 TaxID=1266666 RepID=A0A1G4KAK2_9SACH|nr:LANO_0F10770g1_1 [Lachancea nothofagi CBS 11611]
MIKSTNSIYQLDFPANSTLSPIRESGQSFFASVNGSQSADGLKTNKIPTGNPYSRSIWNSENEYKCNAKQLKKLAAKQQKSPALEAEVSLSKTSPAPSPTEQHHIDDTQGRREDSKKAFTGDEFFHAFYQMLHNEEEYSYVTDALNMIYRKELHNNRKFGEKLIRLSSNEEILLFGNIDTISQLSRILTKILKNYVKTCCLSGTDMEDWGGFGLRLAVPQEFTNIFDPSDFLDSHLNKIKSTYHAYFSSHKKQIELLTALKRNKRSLFYKWYEICLKKSDFLRIEDIIDAPMKRAEEFYEDISNVVFHAENYLLPENVRKLTLFQKRYFEFLREARSLLISEAAISGQSYSRPSSGQNEPHLLVPASDNSCRSSDTHFSLSSSRYSDHSGNEARSDPEVVESTSKAVDIEKEIPTLNDCIWRFKQIEKHLAKLEKEIMSVDLAAILDKNLKQAEEWRKIFEFEPASQLFTEHANVESIYTTYVNKIHQQRQDVMLLKLKDIQTLILEPLSQLRKLCEPVDTKVKDLRTLKKDFISFLKSKDARDIRMEIVAIHFKELQAQLLDELPLFLKLITKLTRSLLIGYNQSMMNYMEILCGGKRLLQRELRLLETGEREPGDNFDILQQFSSSRFYAKQLIRENWNCHGRAVESRAVRRLFEL